MGGSQQRPLQLSFMLFRAHLFDKSIASVYLCVSVSVVCVDIGGKGSVDHRGIAFQKCVFPRGTLHYFSTLRKLSRSLSRPAGDTVYSIRLNGARLQWNNGKGRKDNEKCTPQARHHYFRLGVLRRTRERLSRKGNVSNFHLGLWLSFCAEFLFRRK